MLRNTMLSGSIELFQHSDAIEILIFYTLQEYHQVSARCMAGDLFRFILFEI